MSIRPVFQIHFNLFCGKIFYVLQTYCNSDILKSLLIYCRSNSAYDHWKGDFITMIWSILIVILIVFWFIRLGYQMGYGGAAASDPHSAKKPLLLRHIFQEQVSYPHEKASPREILAVIVMALLLRLAVYLVGLIFTLIHSDAAAFSLDDFLYTWNKWDAPHYITIARDGYAGYIENGEHLFLVFFPLYPWILKFVHIFIPNWELACLTLSTVSFAVGCSFFYAVLSEEYGRSIARKTLVLLSVFPFSFFFGAMMTESLFFCTMAIGFYFIKKHDWLSVGLTGIFCSLSRVQGILLLGVAGVEFLTTYPFFTMYREKRLKEFFKHVFTEGIFILLAPIGNLIYFYLNYRVEGNPFQFTIYQSEHWFHDTTYFTSCLEEIIGYLTNPGTSNTLIMCIWLPELILFVITIVLLAYGLTRHPLKYTAFLLVYTLVNYSVTFLISGGRYMSCAFPLFIIGGEYLDRHPRLYHGVVIISAMTMAMYLTGYLSGKQIM